MYVWWYVGCWIFIFFWFICNWKVPFFVCLKLKRIMNFVLLPGIEMAFVLMFVSPILCGWKLARGDLCEGFVRSNVKPIWGLGIISIFCFRIAWFCKAWLSSFLNILIEIETLKRFQSIFKWIFVIYNR